MTRFREMFAGLRSCFTLTPHERLVIILILAIFLFGLFLRWRHLRGERAETYAPAGRATNELPTR
jgi:hypothetical protein